MNKRLNIFHIDFNYINFNREFLHSWLQRIVDMGFNTILWELEDKIQWESCPECVWSEAMSKADFRELLDYSRSLGLEPIPLLQTIGHAEYVLLNDKYKSFREVPEHYDCYCTENPAVRKFLSRWIEEYLELFGEIKFFHLGGDEAYVFGTCEKCREFIAKHGKHELYIQHIIELAAPLIKRNIRPGIWNDMIMHFPDSIAAIPHNFVIWDWNYWDVDHTPESVIVRGKGLLKKAELDGDTLAQLPEILNKNQELQQFYSAQTLKRLGFDVILCSSSSAAGDNFYCPAPIRAGNIVGAASMVATENLLGNCVTSWGIRLNDYIAQIPFIGLATLALAEPEKSSQTLQYEYCEQLFGCKPDKFVQAAKMLGVSLPFAQAYSTAVQWDKMKGSVPAPKGYLRKYLREIKENNPKAFERFSNIVYESLDKLPHTIELLTEFSSVAKQGDDVIEYWLLGAEFLMAHALIGKMILEDKHSPKIMTFIEHKKSEYKKFLSRRETEQSASKNASLVFDTSIDFFKLDSVNETRELVLV